jgi:probable phosphoglycerate mutase
MSILLIRHGETRLNAARVVQPVDTPLSEVGMRQAEALAQRLRAGPLAALVSSDLARAAMTAEPVARATRLPVISEPMLRERNFGDLRGRAYDTLGFDPLAMEGAPPNGESMPDFRDRVARAFTAMLALQARLGGNLAVVTHGLVVRAILESHVALEPDVGVPARIENTSVTRIETEPPYRVSLLNCVQHLAAGDRGAAHGVSGI